MVSNIYNSAQVRNNPFMRNDASPSSGPNGHGRPKSAVFSSPPSFANLSTPPSHGRNQSQSAIPTGLAPTGTVARHHREGSKGNTPTSNTFAPSFIKTEDMKRGIEPVEGIEGENDFSGKRYVWLKDPETAFVKGWVVEELGGGRILVQCDDGSVSCLYPAWLAVWH